MWLCGNPSQEVSQPQGFRVDSRDQLHCMNESGLQILTYCLDLLNVSKVFGPGT